MIDLIPRDVLFGNPERISPRLSPDGSQLAWIAPHDGVLNVWVVSDGAEGPGHGVDLEAARVVTDDRDRGIRTFSWAHDGRHLLYLKDTGGDENWRLFDVDLTTMERRGLTPFEGVQAQIIGGSPDRPTEILVGLNRDNPELHDVYRIDLVTGELTKEVENPGFVGWIADTDLVVRAALSPKPDGSAALMVRTSADEEWRRLLEIPADDALTTEPLAFTADGKSILVTSSVGEATTRLVRFDVTTGFAEVLAGDPEADVVGVLLHPRTHEPQIVSVLKDRTEYIVLDPTLEADLAAVRALHPGDPVFEGGDDDDKAWLVSFTNDSGPIPYFSYDRTTRQGAFLFEQRPALSNYQLAPMEPFTFTARDGLAIHAYATFPAGVDRSGLPTVLNVHGGPWSRNVWGLDAEAQWLANRGYLCIQVNFRGSAGYGKAFLRRRPGVGCQDARRSGRCRRAHHRARLGKPRSRRHLWRLIRGVRSARRGDVHSGSLLLRRGHRRAFEPEDARRNHPAVLGTDHRHVPSARGRPSRRRRELPLVPFTALPRAGHPDPAVDCAGRQRPSGQAS